MSISILQLHDLYHRIVSLERVKITMRNLANVKEYWFLCLVLFIYTFLIFVVISRHEPWADEAQAWLLARDSGFVELLFKNLRYDGHPGLWYLILMLPSKLLPYRAISFLSGIIAIVGILIFLCDSPFPKIIRILFPFSYFLFYQYGVIARSYVLLPLLLFLIASIYHAKTEKIYTFTVLLCLLAYTSVFSSLIALSLMLIHLIDLIKTKTHLNREVIAKQVKAYAAFAIMIALIAIQLWPPEDASFAKGYRFGVGRFLNLSFSVLNEAMTELSYISAAVLIISLIWFWQRKVLLLYLIPTLAILALFSIKYYNSWHQGIIFLVWAFVMWISFAVRESDSDESVAHGLTRKLATASLLCVLGFHVFWSAKASVSDLLGHYSAGQAVASYIKYNHLEDKKIYATTFWSTSILPYFDRNIFDNHNQGAKPAFWFWATDNRRLQNLEQMLKDKPDLIIIGRPKQPLAELAGYKHVGTFEGNIYWKNRIKEMNHFALYRR
ncbi:MAG: hypothetical protein ACE1ZS_01770 [Candidatus Poribacteria bacterium]